MAVSNVVPQLDDCCCGCRLRTGTKFVGWGCVILGIILLTIYLCAATVLFGDKDKTDTVLTPEQWEDAKITWIFVVILVAVRLLFAILLLIGVYQERLSLYLPWIIYSLVDIVVGVLFVIAMCILQRFDVQFIGILIGTCIQLYFTLVVNSDYRDQKQHGNAGP